MVTQLKIVQISKNYEVNGNSLNVLDSISLNVQKGEFISIVGPSGCGKTTLIRIIAGLELPTSGKVILEDDIITKPLIKIGYVPQEFSLFPWKNIAGNIGYGLKLKGIKKKDRTEEVNALLELVGLAQFGSYYPKDLSGGMKQKVAIARAIAIDQSVLLLDEPLISIDAQNRNKLQEELVEIWQKSERTIIFITHNIDEAVFLSDRIVILSPLPAQIKDIVIVNLERPRDRTQRNFNMLRKEILNLMKA